MYVCMHVYVSINSLLKFPHAEIASVMKYFDRDNFWSLLLVASFILNINARIAQEQNNYEKKILFSIQQKSIRDVQYFLNNLILYQ